MPIRTHHIQKIDLLPQDTALLRFDRQDFHFQSGQHVTVQLPKSDDRDYSLASGEADPFLEILVKRVDDGALSPLLCYLKVFY
jgi:ferredoxin-NADP reductase